MGLRVCNIIEDGRFGGPQARIVAVAEGLRNEGIETIAVLPKDDSRVFQLMLSQKKLQTIPTRLHRISRNIPQLISYFFYFIPELIWLVRILKLEKVDIVHCNGSCQIKGVIAGKLAGKKVVWHLNDTRRIIIIDLFSFLAGKYLCDAFIFAAKRVKDYYLSNKSIVGKPHFVIQAPVDTQFFAPNLVVQDKRIASSPGIKIVSVGNVNPAKGFEHYIEAASRTTCRNDNASFWIVGPRFDSQRRYFDLLEQACKELNVKVHFYGPSTNVRSVLKAGDIYVCSSVHEASPISVWEAMAMEKAIVSTDVGDVSEFISDGENGFIVPVGDAYQLAEKISILIKNPSMRSEFGEKARIAAIEKLDLTIAVKRHVEVYRAVLEN